MPSVLIRDVPDETLARLRARARRQRRSLQHELLRVLERSAREDARDALETALILRERISAYGVEQSDSAELLREDRDEA